MSHRLRTTIIFAMLAAASLALVSWQLSATGAFAQTASGHANAQSAPGGVETGVPHPPQFDEQHRPSQPAASSPADR
jgi:hypothetical protein